ncbi:MULTISPECIES: 1-phosphofructokinase family hexose kinase [unclassified Nocardioides]|uniref:1-phosphofructokinase family hexose kinase n=1 Tax=unclassified Nocardioides TaxID=2615069 RepID=UPI000702698E|nr:MULTISPECIES: 1-phosphofructokinase [unclassified Nocardioides]KRC56862.1 1-phosphofructokinase [Nocardioides sp. Root79]KRC77071.1 1-phosphofructokinase [Nocardioides sp. Root240]
MIVTVTPNPSIDRTLVLPDALVRGGVHRVADALDQPGGKGVNISRACVAAGVPTCAVLPVAPDDPFVAELDRLGVPSAPVPPAGPMRVNLTLTEPDGTTTKLNAAGASVSVADLDALADQVLAQPADGWVVLAGSLPPGAPDDWYADLAARLRATGRRVAVDTSDAALEAVVAGLARGTAPSLLKPNAEELASIVGADESALEGDPALVATAARTLVDRGVGAVLATLGGAGAVLVDATGAWHAVPPPTRVVSTVGAGDSSLFGYLAADLAGAPAPERLAAAVAWGSAAAGLPGTTVPTPDDVRIHEVRVRALDLSATAHEGEPSWQS